MRISCRKAGPSPGRQASVLATDRPDTSPGGPKGSGDPEGAGLRPRGRLLSQCPASTLGTRTTACTTYVVPRSCGAAGAGRMPSTTRRGISGIRHGGHGGPWCAPCGNPAVRLQLLSRIRPNQPPQALPLGREGLQCYLGLRSHSWELPGHGTCELIGLVAPATRLPL